ncbi:MAG: ArsR/SmtB family transcription factor [Bilifractor sp.]|jgi:DNA-binding transcriptional ArsR family regulator
MNKKAGIDQLSRDFTRCRKVLVALGDENRQKLLLEMMKAGPSGVRVTDITETVKLSRPAVSHHLIILKEAGIVNIRHEGTANYYYLEPDQKSLHHLIDVLMRAERLYSETAREEAVNA